jgi:hypothetical protein
MELNEENPKTPRLSAAKKSEIAEAVAKRLLADKKFLEDTADKLHANPSFKRRIILTILFVGLFAAAGYIAFGWYVLRTAISKTNEYATNQFATYIRTNDLELSNQFLVARKELTNQITKHFETEQIKMVVTDVASNRANTILTAYLLPEVNVFRETVSNEIHSIAATVYRLTNASGFVATMLAANGNDRPAFDQLLTWANSNAYPFQQDAEKAYYAIRDRHNLEEMVNATLIDLRPPWGSNPDPKYSTEQFKKVISETIESEYRIALLKHANDRTDFSQHDKMSIAVETIRSDKDLRVVSFAGKMLRDGTGYNMKTLAISWFLEWWDKHHTTLSTNVATQKP